MRWILTMLLLFSINSFGAIYKCEIGGNTVFQDMPCASEEKESIYEEQLITSSCTVDTLVAGFKTTHFPNSKFNFVCDKPANVTKEMIFQTLPNGKVLPESPNKEIKFLQWTTSFGHKYRMELFLADGRIHNATVFKK